MKPPNIPTSFKADGLPRDLERLAQGIVSWAKGLPDPENTIPTVSVVKATTLGFGQFVRVAPADGEVVQLVLPALDKTQGGRAIRIARMNTLGMVFVSAQGNGRIDGLARVLLYNSVEVTTIWYDGAIDYLSDGSTVDLGVGL